MATKTKESLATFTIQELASELSKINLDSWTGEVWQSSCYKWHTRTYLKNESKGYKLEVEFPELDERELKNKSLYLDKKRIVVRGCTNYEWTPPGREGERVVDSFTKEERNPFPLTIHLHTYLSMAEDKDIRSKITTSYDITSTKLAKSINSRLINYNFEQYFLNAKAKFLKRYESVQTATKNAYQLRVDLELQYLDMEGDVKEEYQPDIKVHGSYHDRTVPSIEYPPEKLVIRYGEKFNLEMGIGCGNDIKLSYGFPSHWREPLLKAMHQKILELAKQEEDGEDNH